MSKINTSTDNLRSNPYEMEDNLREFHEETKRIVAEADALWDDGLLTREDIAKFAGLMFKAGFTECQCEMSRLMKLAAFDGAPQSQA